MASAKTGMEAFAEILKNMDPAHKAKLIENHQNFGKLREFCGAKGHIENLPGLTGVIVLKNTKEVKKLREIIDFLKPKGFKWSYKNKKLQKKWEGTEKWEDKLKTRGRKKKQV